MPCRLRCVLHRHFDLVTDSGHALAASLQACAACSCRDDNRCLIFGRPERPATCVALRPSEEMCGSTTEDALVYLTWLEEVTRPDIPAAAG